MTMSLNAPLGTVPSPEALIATFRKRARMSFIVPGIILAYLTWIFFAFDIPGIAARAKTDNAAVLLTDFWAHKTHVTRDNRSGALSVAIEGEGKGTYPAGMLPDWVTVALR